MATLNFKVTGMTCGHCVKAVETALSALSETGDIQSVKVDLKQQFASVSTEQSAEKIIEAIEEDG